jgi:hypothetical protein
MKARAALDARAKDIERLSTLHPTYERTNLLASAWKRRTMLEYAISLVLPSAEAQSAAEHAVGRARELYETATGLANQRQLKNVGYAQLNALAAAAVLELIAGRLPASADEKTVEAIRRSLDEWAKAKPEFWPYAQMIELEIYVALCNGTLAGDLERVKVALEDLFSRMANPHHWATVRDQARFTLRPYARKPRPEPEIAAASELKGILESYARVKP